MDPGGSVFHCTLVCPTTCELENVNSNVIVFRVASSLNAEDDTHSAGSRAVKTLYTSAYMRYPCISLGIEPRLLKASDRFRNAIIAALDSSTDDSKKAALQEVFGTYGHVFQTELKLGALIVHTSSTTVSNNVRVSL